MAYVRIEDAGGGIGSFKSIIKSVWRPKGKDWKVMYRIEEDGPLLIETLGLGGSVRTGPRLDEVLSTMDSTDFANLPKDVYLEDMFEWRSLNNELVFLNLTTEGYTRSLDACRNPLSFDYYKTDSGYIIEELPTGRDHMLVGKVTEVVDGDTLKFDVLKTGEGTKDKFIINGNIDVRLAGIQTPEINTSGNQSKIASNQAYADTFRVSLKDVETVGYESRDFLADNVKEGNGKDLGYVVLQVDRDEDGSYKSDIYGRWICMVYATPFNNVEDAFNLDIHRNTAVVNMNKTLVSTPSLKVDGVPLAVVYGSDNEYGMDMRDGQSDYGGTFGEWTDFDYHSWNTDISYRPDLPNASEIEEQQEQSEKERQKEAIQKAYEDMGRNFTIVEYEVSDRFESLQSIVERYDTTKEIIADANSMTVVELEEWFTPDKWRMLYGSVIKIPTVEEDSEGNKVLTDKFKRGEYKDNKIDIPNIGRDESLEYVYGQRKPSPHSMRIGDVELVVPPLSIEVSKQSKIKKIKTLRSKSSMITNTGSSDIYITMQLFFHDLDSINGEAIPDGNGGVYYINGLRPLLAQFQKAPFVPISNSYLNDAHDIQSVALANITTQTVPGFPHSLSATLTLIKFEHEMYMPMNDGEDGNSPFLDNVINYPMLRWFYQQSMTYRSPYRTYFAPIEGQLKNDFAFQVANEGELLERAEAAQELRQLRTIPVFEEDVRRGDNIWGKLKRDADRYARIMEVKAKMDELREERGGSLSLGSHKRSKLPDGDMYEIYGTTSWNEISEAMYYTNEITSPKYDMPGGEHAPHIIIKLEAPVNQNDFAMYKIGDDRYSIPVYESPGRKIERRGKNADIQTQVWKDNWTKVEQKANMTEGQLTLDEREIDGLILTDINVMLENQFSKTQMQMMESPTLQFLGCQDPYVQLKFKAIGEEAVMKLRETLETVEYYSRRYKYGITSGFLGFKNQLTELFGITTVMPEHVLIRTVPGLIDTYEVDMVLCGFNKTQKRSETLEGAAMYGSSEKEDRHVSNEPWKGDNLKFQEHIRTLEVYPDLELPTYKELDNALSYINAGVYTYPGANDGKFVDPDFYIATRVTVRDVINKGRYEDNKVNFYDAFENKAETEVTSKDKAYNMFKMSDEVIHKMDTISERTKNIKIAEEPSDQGQYMLDVMDRYSGSSASSTTQVAGTKTNSRTVWGNYINEWDQVPSLEQWSEMYGRNIDPGMYADWRRALRNPNAGEVYSELYKWVDYFFGGKHDGVTYYVNDASTLGRTGDAHDYAYATTEEWYIACYNYHADLAGKPRISGYAENSTLRKLVEKHQAKPSRERIANYIKTFWDMESSWHQFKPGAKTLTPFKNSWAPENSAMGIGQIVLSVHAKSMNEARLLTWDWRYNIERSVKYFFDHFKGAVKPSTSTALKIKEGTNGIIELKSRPLDWAVRAYNEGSFFGDYHKKGWYGELATDYYKKFVFVFEGASNSGGWSNNLFGRYNAYQARYASPFGSADNAANAIVNKDIVQTKAGSPSGTAAEKIYLKDRATIVEELSRNYWNSNISAALNKIDKDTLQEVFEQTMPQSVKDNTATEPEFTDAKDYAMRFSSVYKAPSSKTYFKHEMIKSFTSKSEYLQQALNSPKLFTTDEVRELYDEVFSKMADSSHTNYSNVGGVTGLVNEVKNDNYKTYNEVQDLENLKDSEAERLRLLEDPAMAFRDSFTDLIEYDQRGRLIRAFPTFQMFIIDEGRWMSNYRLWDNLYGFNAIQSIDVHRSRKIAADTVVVKMTNMYSNLSSRRLDANYGEWHYNLWENLFKGEPNQELLDARMELTNSMMLKTGARIHLRMGYSANVADLPVMFNGTITEMDTSDLVTIVGQGDGLELTSIISADPNKDNTEFFDVQEPREILCKLLTSKGSWFKDFINYHSDGTFFTESPSGILHFGAPPITAKANLQRLDAFIDNNDYGEAGQNIFSTQEREQFSQWAWNPNEDKNSKDGSLLGFIPKWGDGLDLKISMYGKTTWDMAHDLAYMYPDYITAVHPFENRSTLFFGKPYYKFAYAYEKEYVMDTTTGEWKPRMTAEYRKPYMQFHNYTSYTDIISNNIKASEEGMYTNVIATWENNRTDTIHADFDIRYDKQRTAVVESPILDRAIALDWMKEADQAMFYGCSALRDYMKEMYKGQLVVLGDPTVKPYDMCHLADEATTMNGPFQVEAVTHHFSHETGFITSITPDVVAVIDDQMLISQTTWMTSAGAGAATFLGTKFAGMRAFRALAKTAGGEKAIMASKWTGKHLVKIISHLPRGHEALPKFNDALRKYIDAFDKGKFEGPNSASRYLDDMKKHFNEMQTSLNNWDSSGGRTKSSSKKMLSGILDVVGDVINDLDVSQKTKQLTFTNTKTKLKSAKDGVKFAKTLKLLSATNLLSLVASLGVSVATGWLGDLWVRNKKEKQAILVIPMKYMGRDFTAGINGHKGMVIGDPPGKWDKFYMGMGLDEDGSGAWIGQMLNIFFDGDATSNIVGGIAHWATEGEVGTSFEETSKGSISYGTNGTYEDLYEGAFGDNFEE